MVIRPAAMKLELAFLKLPAVVLWVKHGVLLVSCALLWTQVSEHPPIYCSNQSQFSFRNPHRRGLVRRWGIRWEGTVLSQELPLVFTHMCIPQPWERLIFHLRARCTSLWFALAEQVVGRSRWNLGYSWVKNSITWKISQAPFLLLFYLMGTPWWISLGHLLTSFRSSKTDSGYPWVKSTVK